MEYWDESDYEDSIEEGKWVVKFGADFCAPCKALEATIKNIEDGYDLNIVSVSTDDMLSKTIQLGISGLPTVVCFVDGEEIGRFSGNLNAESLDDIFTKWEVYG